MKIGIEAQRIFRPDKHGMDFVVLEVLRCLQQQDDGNEYVVFVAPGEDRCLQSTARMQVVELSCPTYPLWEQWALPRAVRRSGVELLHCTSNTAPLYCPVPLVLTLHDIIFLHSEKTRGMSAYQQMGWYYRRWNVPRIVDKCRAVITVSETERRNILHRFPQLAMNLHVVHNGCGSQYHIQDLDEVRAITRKYLPQESYLLHLGNTDPRKNTPGVLRAYNEYLNRSASQLPLVLTGLSRQQVEAQLVEMGIEACASKIVYTGYVPGSDLPALYAGAFAFLFPSLKEGFGIPVIESMACGTPVITSNCSSLPEVAGREALLINPQKPEEITDLLIRLEEEPELYGSQVAYGLKHAKHFTWEFTTEQYLRIYANLKT